MKHVPRSTSPLPRRAFLRGLGGFAGLSAAFYNTPGLFAEQLFATPRMTEGPFYPDHLPLDCDNDLIIAGDRTTPAVGQITHLTGRILTSSGVPVSGATIEIWQCDANAVYLHSADSGPKKAQQDPNFQGFGIFTTNSKGEYRFRTIKPVAYPGRPAPHIHFMVKQNDRAVLTSQIFVRGDQGNLRDGIFASAGDLIDRELVMADFKPLKESKLKELAASFDIVLGRTPDEGAMERRRRPNT